MRISDWSSDVCSSDRVEQLGRPGRLDRERGADADVDIVRPAQIDLVEAGDVVAARGARALRGAGVDRKSVVERQRVSVCGERGGLRSINKKKERRSVSGCDDASNQY